MILRLHAILFLCQQCWQSNIGNLILATFIYMYEWVTAFKTGLHIKAQRSCFSDCIIRWQLNQHLTLLLCRPILLQQGRPTFQTWVWIIITCSCNYLLSSHHLNARPLNVVAYLFPIPITCLNTSLRVCCRFSCCSLFYSYMKMLLIGSGSLWKVNCKKTKRTKHSSCLSSPLCLLWLIYHT